MNCQLIMKVKSIILSGMLLLGVGASTTSCEDMFTADNNKVSTNLAPADSLFQTMGIIKSMQKLADRTVLLGEVRADLVTVDPLHASSDIQELANNNVSETNVYNNPSDYYAVINNCNVYLSTVDSLLKTHGEYYYEKEICAVKCFRAWCYLELAKIYGEVPLVTEPVLSSSAAEDIVASGKKANMEEILDFCIKDLAKYPYMSKNLELRSDYGRGASYNGYTLDKYVIPVRVMLAELYFWRASYTGKQSDYIDAIRMYHDFFCFPDEEKSTNYYSVGWEGTSSAFTRSYSSYTSRFATSSELVAMLPVDSVEYFGTTSSLRAVFNSQYSNNYYPAVVASEDLKTMSKAQDYCRYMYLGDDAALRDTIYGSHVSSDYTSELLEGDLRLSRIFNTESNLKNSEFNSNANTVAIYNSKYLEGVSMASSDKRLAAVTLFRTSILYLHLAEALNNAGFPETAFAILAYGLTYDVMNDRDIISQDEFDRLCEIKSYGFTIQEPLYTGDMLAKTTGTFVIWPSTVFYNVDKNNTNYAYNRTVATSSGSTIVTTKLYNIGIHSYGSGDTEYNKKYYLDDSETLANLLPDVEKPEYEALPKLNSMSTAEDSAKYDAIVAANADLEAKYIKAQAEVEATNAAYLASDPVRTKRQAHVRELILDEEALEGSFEGTRFYDLLRYQMQNNNVNGVNATIKMPEYIATKYGITAPARMVGRPWYLPLRNR